MGFSLKFGTWEWLVWLLFLLNFLSGDPTLTHALNHLGLTADTCINVIQHLAQEGETLPTLCFPAALGAWFVLACLKEVESWHAFRWVCCPCVCTLLPSYPRNNTSSLHQSPAQYVLGAFAGVEIPTWPYGPSNLFSPICTHQALVLSASLGFRGSSSQRSHHSQPVDSKLHAQNSKELKHFPNWQGFIPLTSYEHEIVENIHKEGVHQR